MADHRKAPLATSWSNLPQEIVSRIERRLDSGLDVFQFRSVCKNWSSTRKHGRKSLLSASLPCKISNVNLPFTDRPNDPLILFARAVFRVRPRYSSTGWLLTVEETNPGKLQIMYPLSNDHVKHLPSNFPKYLDLSKFRVSEIAKSYGFKYASDNEDVVSVRKVIFCSGGCNATAMILYGKGSLVGVRLKNGNWGYVRDSLICSIKDVINFNGMVYAVDHNLDVMVIDYKTMNAIHRIVPTNKTMTGSCYMHLVESNMMLHLVKWDLIRDYCRTSVRFNVYRLDETQAKWDPKDCLKSWVIFVSLGWCFVADVPHFNGDFIVYSGDCLTSSDNSYCDSKYQLFGAASMNLDISVFFRSKGISLCNGIADWLWPPLDDGDDEESGIYNPEISLSEDLLPPYLAVAPAKASTISKQDLSATIASRNALKTDENSHALSIQLNQNHSTMMFEGVNIKSNLVPTLQKVWAKYGNILTDCKIRNADIVARALESLATALVILETSSGRSLNKTQADYLSSVLCDTQQMNIKVEWLVPFVDKALAVLKSRSLINSLKDFGRAKAQAEEMKLKVLDELAKLDELEEYMVLVSERLLDLKSMDFDQSLGEGLY